jgi:mono/diheme cytochrome c family protein
MKLRKLCTLLLLIASGRLALAQAPEPSSSPDPAKASGISFPSDSQSTVVLERDGKRYLIDVAAKTVREMPADSPVSPQPVSDKGTQPAAALFSKNCAGCHGPDGKGNKSLGTPNFTDPVLQKGVSDSDLHNAIRNGKGGIMPAWSGKLTDGQISSLVTYIRSFATGSTSGGANQTSSSNGSPAETQQNPTIYTPGDDLLISLPTGRPTDRHGLYVNFTHRFPYSPAFTGPAEGAQLFGLDNVAIPSFGFRYGVTDNLSVSVYRSPSLINRPIQIMAGYNILEERKADPFNLMVRVSIEGQDNFRKNYTENIEAILSRSITARAQFYLVPTVSFNDRRLVAPAGFFSNEIADVPGVTAFSLGAGLAIDVRPTVALLAEIIPTLANADALGIHRPAFSFGIQKKIWRHAFTLGLTTSPGTTVSQRAATRAQLLNDPGADTFGGLMLGFDLTRQIK